MTRPAPGLWILVCVSLGACRPPSRALPAPLAVSVPQAAGTPGPADTSSLALEPVRIDVIAGESSTYDRAGGAPARGPAPPGRDASVTTNVELVKTIATKDEGVAELVAAIARHRERCAGAAGLARARVRAAAQLTELVKDRLADRAQRALAASGGIEDLAAEVVDKTIDPYTASERVLALALGKL